MKKTIDINCDLGEGADQTSLIRDIEILDFISSANVSCGFHAGKLEFIEQLIGEAVDKGVCVGAHPAYPDKQGFGRRPMQVGRAELTGLLKIQINSIVNILDPMGESLRYVKPHGALYHSIMQCTSDADALIDAILSIDPSIAIMGAPDSIFREKVIQNGLPYISEGFADRTYNSDGSLVSRSEKEATIENVEDAIIQTMLLVENKKVKIPDGFLSMEIDSICIHGDNPEAINILKGIRGALIDNGYEIKSKLQS